MYAAYRSKSPRKQPEERMACEEFRKIPMRVVVTGIAVLISTMLGECDSQTLSRSDAQAALITLCEGKGMPLTLTIPGLKSGHIRYFTGKLEGISPGIWYVDLSKRTFLFVVASPSDQYFYSCSGVFKKSRGEWKAEVTGETMT
jgi:hypothetical protein